MIGVIADGSGHEVVWEFFELFKTPWEFYRTGSRYEVLLCCGDHARLGDLRSGGAAKLVVIYSSKRLLFDDEQNIRTDQPRRAPCFLSYRGTRIPIYGDSITFPDADGGPLTVEHSQDFAAYVQRSGERVLARIGYDLFDEIGKLLTVGQPSSSADTPSLELHIALLRELITGSGLRLVEVPPVPDGYAFTACLTHDVDHPSIRQHKCDRTMVGFLYRAIFGSLLDVFRRRIGMRTLVTNWVAATKLPFVYLGLTKDFWRDFDDRYLECEKGLASTFFVIPFRNCPGRTSDGSAPEFRAARYGAADIADSLAKLKRAGCEIGLHGIDAWVDSARGRAELEEIRRLTGVSEIGVRMHWLYYDSQQSPATLEHAGAAFDSTIGYNNTVGYRAGTTQVYKPLDTGRLLELPLHAMDTALFYPAYLGLSPRHAAALLVRLVDNAVRFGGCLTTNWHDRSLAPERAWGESYRDLLEEMKSRGAWFCTAEQAVSWFRRRRSVVFEAGCIGPDAVRARVTAKNAGSLPGLRLRIYDPRVSSAVGSGGSQGYVDTVFGENVDSCIASATGP